MTYKEMKDIVAAAAAAAGCSLGYYKGKETEGQLLPDLPELPAMLYVMPETDGFYADGVVYAPIVSCVIYFYSREKDFAAEDAIMETLKLHGIGYRRSELYITTEEMYEIEFRTEEFIRQAQSAESAEDEQ